MRSSNWTRTLAGILALFALGHTLGTAVPKVTRGAAEAATFAAMQRFRFPVMGYERTYWEFYRGFALSISVLLAAMAVVAWQLATIAERDPRRALPMAVTLAVACAAQLAISRAFFFGAPIVMSLAALVISAVVVALLTREARRGEAVAWSAGRTVS